MRRMYSEEQLKKLILESVNNDIQSGQITLKIPIEVTMSGWKAYDNTATLTEDITIDDIYTKIEYVGGILMVVANIKITNTGASSLTYPTIRQNVTLPADIADKIVDITGKKVSESSNACITGTPFIRGLDSSFNNTANWGFLLVNTVTANTMQLFFKDISTIAAGASMWFTARVPLTI